MAEENFPKTAWQRALPIFREKPEYTKEISDVMEKKVAPVIDKKCKAWATNEDEYKACRRFLTRGIIDRFFSLDRKTISEISKQAKVDLSEDDLPSPVDNDQTGKDVEEYIRNKCGDAKGKSGFACLVNNYTNVMRAIITGMFVGSKEEEKSPYYLKPKSKPGKIRISNDEYKIFQDAIETGKVIKETCENFAEKHLELDDDRKIAYTYCRITNVFRSLPGNLPRRLEVKQASMARKLGLIKALREVIKETQSDLTSAREAFMKEELTRMSYLKDNMATKPPIPYITARIAKRAVTSTIGNAIAKAKEKS